MTDRMDLRAIEQFVYREARLLDSRHFEDWLALFTDDAIYWVPAGHDDIDPTQHVSIIYDTVAGMQKRVGRLNSGFAFAQEPASRTHRLVSNVEIINWAEDGSELEIATMMLLVELSRHNQTIHSARCEFRLRRQGDVWKIVRKKVNLLRNNEVLESTPYLL
jgi:3-phenylpropionate/cinnamic acid dioxygenase small subunit